MQDRINTIEELKAFITYAVLATEGNMEFVSEEPYQIMCSVAGKPAQIAKQIERNTSLQFMSAPNKLYMLTDKDKNVSIGLIPAGNVTQLIAKLNAEYMQDMAKFAKL